MNRILLLGATGAVGSASVVAVLSATDAMIVLAGRDRERLRDMRGRLIADGHDSARLAARVVDATVLTDQALAEIDTVINCAEPSYRLSEPVMNHVAARCNYVDVGGDQKLIGKAAPIFAAHGHSAIIGAGVQPGLVGLATRAVGSAAQPAEPADLLIRGWAGGVQPMTPAGLSEYLHSMSCQIGYPNTVFVDGRLQRPEPDDPEPVSSAPFPASARTHLFLDEEQVTAAGELGVGQVMWHTVTDPPEVEKVLARSMAGALDESAAIVTLDALISGRRRYFTIAAEAHSRSSSKLLTRTVLGCTESYVLSGQVAAYVSAFVDRCPPGARWLSQMPDPLTHWNNMNEVSSAAVVWPALNHDSMSEGAL